MTTYLNLNCIQTMTDNDQNQQLSVNVPHSFDDLPVGKTNFAVPPAYLEEHDNTIKTSKSEQREMTTMQRVEKKLKSNVWKTRK